MGTVKLLLLYCSTPYILPKIFCVWVKFFRRYILTKPIDLHSSAAAVHHKSDRPFLKHPSSKANPTPETEETTDRPSAQSRSLIEPTQTIALIRPPSSKANLPQNTEETIELQALKICAVFSFSSGNVGETIGSSPRKVATW